MLEIERKFLVKSNSFLESYSQKFEIKQGYLSDNPNATVRVRIKGEIGFLTIKGKGNTSGTTRLEWEKEIALEEAKSLFALCVSGSIEKTRYEVFFGKHCYEVDVFEGNNKGLILAEIELQSEDEYFEKPNWLGEEVTGNVMYYNSNLCKNNSSGGIISGK